MRLFCLGENVNGLPSSLRIECTHLDPTSIVAPSSIDEVLLLESLTNVVVDASHGLDPEVLWLRESSE